MKVSITKPATGKTPPALSVKQGGKTVSSPTSAQQPRSSFDDLHARITTRAYELYAERDYRTGCELEDWLDAEREILSREFPPSMC